MFKPFLALFFIPVVCAAQPASVELRRPADVPNVMTTQVMGARIETLSLELQAIGRFLTVDTDGRLRCACSGVPTVPNGPRPGPRSPQDTQHLIQALQALQLVLNNERAGLETTIYSTQLPKVGRATAVPQLTPEKNFLRP